MGGRIMRHNLEAIARRRWAQDAASRCCACDEPATHEIPDVELSVPPKPLLPN